jgi:hypothetical protein
MRTRAHSHSLTHTHTQTHIQWIVNKIKHVFYLIHGRITRRRYTPNFRNIGNLFKIYIIFYSCMYRVQRRLFFCYFSWKQLVQSAPICWRWFPARGFFFLPWRWSRYVPPKRLLTQDLHSATSQKTIFFIVTAVKTSNLTHMCTFKF